MLSDCHRVWSLTVEDNCRISEISEETGRYICSLRCSRMVGAMPQSGSRFDLIVNAHVCALPFWCGSTRRRFAGQVVVSIPPGLRGLGPLPTTRVSVFFSAHTAAACLFKACHFRRIRKYSRKISWALIGLRVENTLKAKQHHGA